MKANAARLLLLGLASGLCVLTLARASNPPCPTTLLCSTAQASCTQNYAEAVPPSLCDDTSGTTWYQWRYVCMTPPADGPCLKPYP